MSGRQDGSCAEQDVLVLAERQVFLPASPARCECGRVGTPCSCSRSSLSSSDRSSLISQVSSTSGPGAASPSAPCSRGCLSAMASTFLHRARAWLLEVEMGVVWGVAGAAIVLFVFLAIWFIDPALLTLVLRFRQARCQTNDAAFLVGISNCSWTSCRLGCTREIYKCWQVKVDFEYVSGTEPHNPPWVSLTTLFGEHKNVLDGGGDAAVSNEDGVARLYPNVRGCGYPPELDCDKFYKDFGDKDRGQFDCWVSTIDPSIAMTHLDLDRAKSEVIYSLVPLFIFIASVLYAFCRLGVFSVCNPVRLCCPKANDDRLDLSGLSPKRLFEHKKNLLERKRQALSALKKQDQVDPAAEVVVAMMQQQQQMQSRHSIVADTIEEDDENGSSKTHSHSSSSLSKKGGKMPEESQKVVESISKSESAPLHGELNGHSTVAIRRSSRSVSSSLSSSAKSSRSVSGKKNQRRDSLEKEILALDILDASQTSGLKRSDSRSAWQVEEQDFQKKES